MVRPSVAPAQIERTARPNWLSVTGVQATRGRPGNCSSRVVRAVMGVSRGDRRCAVSEAGYIELYVDISTIRADVKRCQEKKMHDSGYWTGRYGRRTARSRGGALSRGAACRPRAERGEQAFAAGARGLDHLGDGRVSQGLLDQRDGTVQF